MNLAKVIGVVLMAAGATAPGVPLPMGARKG